MGQDSIDVVKQETRFFMEKSFQVSFGYVGALVALAAVVSFDLLAGLATLLGVSEEPLLAVAILVTNVTYLTLASACVFATLKRGYYILFHAPDGVEDKFGDYRHWEVFVRVADPPLASKRFFNWLNWLTWNVDNFYMVPLFLLIVGISILATAYGLNNEESDSVSRLVVAVLSALHVVPAACLFANWRLYAKCRRRALSINRLDVLRG